MTGRCLEPLLSAAKPPSIEGGWKNKGIERGGQDKGIERGGQDIGIERGDKNKEETSFTTQSYDRQYVGGKGRKRNIDNGGKNTLTVPEKNGSCGDRGNKERTPSCLSMGTATARRDTTQLGPSTTRCDLANRLPPLSSSLGFRPSLTRPPSTTPPPSTWRKIDLRTREECILRDQLEAAAHNCPSIAYSPGTYYRYDRAPHLATGEIGMPPSQRAFPCPTVEQGPEFIRRHQLRPPAPRPPVSRGPEPRSEVYQKFNNTLAPLRSTPPTSLHSTRPRHDSQ